MFVGSVSDNIDQRIDQKIFHAEIVVDSKKVKAEETRYLPIPILTDFKDDTEDKSQMKYVIQKNYERVKKDVRDLVNREIERIKEDPVLCRLLPKVI